MGVVKSTTAPITSHHVHEDPEDPDQEPNPLVEAFEQIKLVKNRCADMYPKLLNSFARTLTAGKTDETDLGTLQDDMNPRKSSDNTPKWYRKLEEYDY